MHKKLINAQLTIMDMEGLDTMTPEEKKFCLDRLKKLVAETAHAVDKVWSETKCWTLMHSHTDSLQEAAKGAPGDEVAPIAAPNKGCADILAHTRKSNQLRGRSRRAVQNEAMLRIPPVVPTTPPWLRHSVVVCTTGTTRSVASFCTDRRDLPRSWCDFRVKAKRSAQPLVGVAIGATSSPGAPFAASCRESVWDTEALAT